MTRRDLLALGTCHKKNRDLIRELHSREALFRRSALFFNARKIAVTRLKIPSHRQTSPMSSLDLIFDGKAFAVPKKCVFDLLEHCKLFQATSYPVQSSVPLAIFEAFVDWLKTQRTISVTKENAVSLSLLAKEFFLPDLAAECASYSVSVDQFSSLSERVSQLERQFASFSHTPRKVEEAIEFQEEELENLRSAIRTLRSDMASSTLREIASRERGLEDLYSAIERLRSEIATTTQRETESRERGLENLRSQIERVNAQLAPIAQSTPGFAQALRNLIGEVNQLSTRF
jgi:septal ring factor EnvC (AmiA/AmiB activator)